jgi:hypothetical protein
MNDLHPYPLQARLDRTAVPFDCPQERPFANREQGPTRGEAFSPKIAPLARTQAATRRKGCDKYRLDFSNILILTVNLTNMIV